MTSDGARCETERMKSVFTVDSFSPLAKKMRADFDERFRDPREARSDRFIWDYWHVPGQYTALRTPAYHFFPKRIYDEFHNRLVWWGRRELGCHDVSPPWMSCYIDGCKQELHGDLPHGPWAFVFSLTPWTRRKFSGGQTLLVRDEILDYWNRFDSSQGLERDHVFREIEPRFNRLTVFDPRVPHGVREVKGVQDICDGRLVIHGWFANPRPFIEGPVTPSDLQEKIDGLSLELEKVFAHGIEVRGVVSIRMNVSAQGRVTATKTLSNSLRNPHGDVRVERALLKLISKSLAGARFRPRKSPSTITLPLIFEL